MSELGTRLRGRLEKLEADREKLLELVAIADADPMTHGRQRARIAPSRRALDTVRDLAADVTALLETDNVKAMAGLAVTMQALEDIVAYWERGEGELN